MIMAVLCALLAAGTWRAQGQAVAPSAEELPDLSATEAVRLLCARTITAVEYVQALNDRYEAGGYACNNPYIEGSYNLSLVLDEAAAIDAKADRGEDITPLCGLPLAVKDAIDVVGYPTTCATPAFRDLYPMRNTPLIDQYIAANGIILGKTNLGELQSGGSTNPNGAGWITTALNPYDPTRTPAGSSSGSGVALASRIAPLALCEDTGGSCLGPASANGLYTLRPTIGCYNFSDGLMPFQFTRDTVGSIARTADDLILLDSIVRNSVANTTGNGAVATPISCAAGVDPSFSLAGVRLGLPSTYGWETPGISAEITDAISSALERLQQAGVELVPFNSSRFNTLATQAWPGPIPAGALDGATQYEATDTLARWLLLHNSTLSVPEVYRQINRPAARNSSLASLRAYSTTVLGSRENFVNYIKNTRPAIATYWNEVIATYNLTAFMSPSALTEQPPIDHGTDLKYFFNASGSYVVSVPSTTRTIPQIAGSSIGVPIGLSTHGTPVGMQFFGPPGWDQVNLNLLSQLQNIFDPIPPPPNPSLCAGCTADVSVIPVTYNASSGRQPLPNESWSGYTLTFSGETCSQTYLDYGQQGELGKGPAPEYLGSQTNITDMMDVISVASIS